MINDSGSPPPKPDISVRLELWTPKKAKDVLDKLNGTNREMRNSLVTFLERLMNSGEFTTTHQGIAFDIHGNLIDGQHRLQAIVNSGRSFWIMTTRAMPPKAISAIDRGAGRSMADAVRLTYGKLVHITTSHIGVARQLCYNNSGRGQASPKDTAALLLKYGEAIEFAMVNLNHRAKGVRSGPPRAVVTRAIYTGADETKLETFCRVLRTGMMEHPNQAIIIRLRDRMMNPKINVGSREARRDLYARTERALRAFLDDEPLDNLLPATKELFPIDEDKAEFASKFQRVKPVGIRVRRRSNKHGVGCIDGTHRKSPPTTPLFDQNRDDDSGPGVALAASGPTA